MRAWLWTPEPGSRIFAGVGYGGPCLPKDIGALQHLARQTGAGSGLLRAVIGANERQWQLPLRALRNRFDSNLYGESRNPRPELQARNRPT